MLNAESKKDTYFDSAFSTQHSAFDLPFLRQHHHFPQALEVGAGFDLDLGVETGVAELHDVDHFADLNALEVAGGQEYTLKPGPLSDRFAAAYGDTAAAEVASHLPA